MSNVSSVQVAGNSALPHASSAPAPRRAGTAPVSGANAVRPFELAAVRLVNWYHFSDVTLPITGSAMLLGDNGSGKSTVLDAIQLALVADLTEVRFNKAANEHSERNAYTYVRWKARSESKQEMRFQRPAPCTGYVMLEFRRHGMRTDDIAAGVADVERFTVGVVMDAGEQYRALDKAYFVAPGLGTADIPAVTDARLVRPRTDFRTAFRALPGAGLEFLTDTAGYRARLRQRLGPLPDSFHRLLAKGLEFKPMGQVRDFVMNYLAEPVAIQTAHLVADLENYKSLEQHAAAAVERVALLSRVCAQGAKAADERRTLESHRYVALRAEVDVRDDAEAEKTGELHSTELTHAALAGRIAAVGHGITALEDSLRTVQRDLAQSDAAERARQAEAHLKAVRDKLATARAAKVEVDELLQAQRRALDLLLGDEARGVRANWEEQRLLPDDALFGSLEPPERIAALREQIEQSDVLEGHARNSWRQRLGTARKQVEEAGYRLNEIEREWKREAEQLERELRVLDSGRVQYPDGTEALLHLLKARLPAPKRAPQPLCELLDVATDRWRHAVEGVLGSRRFDLLVAPEDFVRAAQLYERHLGGVEVPRRGLLKLHSVALADLGRILEQRPRARPGSLAEQVLTDDPLARAYVDYHLGDMMCCERVEDLRAHRSAVTPSVMIYQSFSVRHPHPRTYTPGVLGARAREARRTEIGARLAALSDDLQGLDQARMVLGRAAGACERAVLAAERLPDLVAIARGVKQLEWDERDAARRVEMLDLREIAPLKARERELQAELEEARTEQASLHTSRGAVGAQLTRMREELEAAHSAAGRARDAFEAAFPSEPPERWAAFAQTYERELDTGATAADIHQRFDASRKSYEGRHNNAVNELTVLKAEYNTRYGEIGDARGEGYDDYRVELAEWEETRLPAYHARMQAARQSAVERLAEDVVSQLGAHFARLEKEFGDLNRALKDVTFGTDQYRFVAEPAPEMREFYDLVKEASRFRLDRDSLFGDQALPAHLKETLDAMVGRLIGQATTQVKTDLERMTDYREYYRYDIRIEEADGRKSSFEASSGEDSGGETQTPYYVAVLASMYQMYRTLLPDRRPRCGLVLLDEAFSKMDGPRIGATLEFVRSLGLQLVLATPKEKVELVAPQVGTCLLIHKDPTTRVPAVYDCTRDLAGDGGPGDASDTPDDTEAAA